MHLRITNYGLVDRSTIAGWGTSGVAALLTFTGTGGMSPLRPVPELSAYPADCQNRKSASISRSRKSSLKYEDSG